MSEAKSEVNNRAILEVPGPIFNQPWWLEALAPGQWGAVTTEKNGELVARMPYVIKKRYGLTVITMPPLTQTLGPWIRPSEAKYTNMLAEQKELMTDLIKKLPPFHYFRQLFHNSITNWLPFYWQGFQQTTLYTYVIEDLSDPDAVWAGMKDSVRRAVHKAEKQVKVRDDLGVDKFLDLNSMTFARQGRELPYSKDLVRRLDAACAEHVARKIFFAEDAKEHIHAALYIVFNEYSVEGLMSGSDPEFRNSEARSLLMWEALKFASGIGKRFNFGGSMMESVEFFLRAFGGRQTPYFLVSKVNSHLLRKSQLVLTHLAKALLPGSKTNI